MHPLFEKADELSDTVIGAAIEVHRLKGPGLLESIYEKCFMRELELRQIGAVNQRIIRIEYKGFVFEEPLRFDVLVENWLLLELKSVQEVLGFFLWLRPGFHRGCHKGEGCPGRSGWV